MAKARYLSKSRFKEAWECPTRLFYTSKPQYGTTTADDAFLQSLADGGFQVGALARQYHSRGILIETLDLEQAALETSRYMRQNDVILFEAAVIHENMTARIDLLVKRGNAVDLIEVKSKSIDGLEDSFFKKVKKGKPPALASNWVSYIADVAFQQVVLRRAYPDLTVTPYLMLADKSKRATVDGLHQRFLLQRAGRATKVHVAPGGENEALGERILTAFDVSKAVAALDASLPNPDGTTFVERVDAYAAAYATDTKIEPRLGSYCRRCPYRIDRAMKDAGLMSGFDACWAAVTGLTSDELEQPLVIDVGGLDVPGLVGTSHFLLTDVEQGSSEPHPGEPGKLLLAQRRGLLIHKLKHNDPTAYFDAAGMRDALDRFVYPLHMIDFETMRAAVPFHKGSRPYAQLAFQFSHHTVQADGSVAHAGQFLVDVAGEFPNHRFARALRDALAGDQGTILRYAPHENTVLCDIIRELEEAEHPPHDRDELVAWLRSITHGPAGDRWEGPRDMVDMLELVKSFYFHPATGGSNSIKDVLPAVLQDSAYLRAKYGEPIYGAPQGIPSCNFRQQRWVEMRGGRVRNPYTLLPPIFADGDDENSIARLFAHDDIAEGGAAMTAYARMQFTQMQPLERRQVAAALLKYCELDTLAMVMIFEHWRSLLE